MNDKQLHRDSTGLLNLFRSLVSIIYKSSRSTEKELGLGAAQYFVLQKLSDGQSRSVNELAELTHTHQSTVSVVIKKLVAKKMIVSSTAEDDARRLSLRLSVKGKRALESLKVEAVQDCLISAISRLSPKDAEELERLMGILMKELSPAEQPAPLFLED
ncbi:MAG: MarR family transcriptional regulator [Proteobacteria bacterium]|nr:MAG: MarR family transcriptional regulator [Pseudomonadota bacterium]